MCVKKDKAHMFHTLWLQLGDPDIEGFPEYPSKERNEPPLVNGRKFRADFVFPEQKVIVEVDGGVYGFQFFNKKTGRYEKRRGGHSSISGQLKDMERGNLLAARGWRILRFTPKQLHDTPHTCINMVLDSLNIEREIT
jgi:very-short-patch-repair endonuclease